MSYLPYAAAGGDGMPRPPQHSQCRCAVQHSQLVQFRVIIYQTIHLLWNAASLSTFQASARSTPFLTSTILYLHFIIFTPIIHTYLPWKPSPSFTFLELLSKTEFSSAHRRNFSKTSFFLFVYILKN